MHDNPWRAPRLSYNACALPDRFRPVRRVATTRIGRHCHPLIPRF